MPFIFRDIRAYSICQRNRSPLAEPDYAWYLQLGFHISQCSPKAALLCHRPAKLIILTTTLDKDINKVLVNSIKEIKL